MFPKPTGRLAFRGITHADLDAIHAYASDPVATQFMEWGPNTREETNAFIDRVQDSASHTPRMEFTYAVVTSSDGAVIGSAGLRFIDGTLSIANLGYVFRRSAWGNGYATEAALALVEFGFETLGCHRIVGRCCRENTASAAVLVNAGMRFEGMSRQSARLRGEWRDSRHYAILRRDHKYRR